MKISSIYRIILLISFSLFVTGLFAQRHHHRAKKHEPHFRYNKLPHWGNPVRSVPRGAFMFPHAGVQYHYNRGIFYKPVGPKYIIARAPVGVRVGYLPQGNLRFVLAGRTYFYYYGTYYVRSNTEYVTVNPPIGARVDALPDGYKKLYLEDRTYYEFEGTFYKAVMDEYGEVFYEVVRVN